MCGYMKRFFQIIGLFFCSIANVYGSFVIYNNSLYQLEFIVTVQINGQTSYISAKIAPAPVNSDGSLQTQPVNAIYIQGSNVPVGTVVQIPFQGIPIDFNLKILNTTGQLIKLVNVGASLGSVVATDLARDLYVYSNVDLRGNPVANSGGACYYWDSAHANPVVQTFP